MLKTCEVNDLHSWKLVLVDEFKAKSTRRSIGYGMAGPGGYWVALAGGNLILRDAICLRDSLRPWQGHGVAGDSVGSSEGALFLCSKKYKADVRRARKGLSGCAPRVEILTLLLPLTPG